MIYEGDAKNVVNHIKTPTGLYCYCGHLIEDILALLSILWVWDFCYVKREVNHVAHLPAKGAVSLISDSVLLDKVLDCIKHLVISYENTQKPRINFPPTKKK